MSTLSKISALDVSHLTVMYRNTVALSDVSVTIERGSMVGIIGPNGAGKTTFVKSVLNLIPRSSGVVTFFNKPFQDARKQIAYVAQRSSIDWDFPMTVFDMVLMGCYGRLGWFKRPTTADRHQVYEILEKVGLQLFCDTPIGALSGGQQQRVFLARALMQKADLFFLDEPFAAVDIATEKILIQLFKELCAQGRTIIAVHHDTITAATYFDSIMLLNKTCIAYGKTDSILRPVLLQKTYEKSVLQ